jgi:hypothetical protein
MKAAISKIIGLLIFLSATCGFAETKLPRCIVFTFGNCLGALKYPNGDIYTGEFNFGQPNGSGKIIYANGDVYIGNFYEGQKHGSGDYTWADGNRYIGQFVEGHLEGRGAYYFLSKNKKNPDKYFGDFKNNKFNGDGVYTHGNGAVVAGKFKDGKKLDEVAIAPIAESRKTPDTNANIIDMNTSGEKIAVNPIAPATNKTTAKQEESLALSPNGNGKTTENNPPWENTSPAKSFTQKGRFFVSGSINSAKIDLLNVPIADGTKGDQKLDWTVDDIPFSLGLGYNLHENYGIEVGFKYHGLRSKELKTSDFEISNNSWRSSSWLLGGFLDVPINSAIGISIKGGIQNTDTRVLMTRTAIDTATQIETTRFSSSGWSSYYGLGLSYAIDKDNIIYLDWTRLRSSLSNSDSSPVSVDFNTDATGLGFKHTF